MPGDIEKRCTDGCYEKRHQAFFLASIFCAVFCIGIFVWGSLTMIRQGEQASMTLGEIYMKAMNFQM